MLVTLSCVDMQLKNSDEINIEKNYLTTTEKLYHKPTFRVSECADDQKVDGKVMCDIENKLINQIKLHSAV